MFAALTCNERSPASCAVGEVIKRVPNLQRGIREGAFEWVCHVHVGRGGGSLYVHQGVGQWKRWKVLTFTERAKCKRCREKRTRTRRRTLSNVLLIQLLFRISPTTSCFIIVDKLQSVPTARLVASLRPYFRHATSACWGLHPQTPAHALMSIPIPHNSYIHTSINYTTTNQHIYI